MPSKNTVRYFDTETYYHIYNRGAGKAPIFYDDKDRYKFISLLERYLDPTTASIRGDGLAYEQYDVNLIAYCLMDNHFHMLLYQQDDVEAITALMRSISTAYTMYFNKRHKRSGHLFQGVFKASPIRNENYLLHITRYIHMNPRSYLQYQWSSIAYYLGSTPPAWLHPDIVNDFTPEQYRQFLRDYEGKKAELELLKDELAL